ncbi:hypothetical protein [Streptomonospora litoralis]|nr:hypothetical protein [Streptomonospora litoralis]
MEQERPAWRGRSARRAVAVFWALVFAALVLSALLSEQAGIGDAWWVMYAVWLVPSVALRLMTRGIAEGPADRLDERELGFRARYLALGYYTALISGAVVAIYLVVVSHVDPGDVVRGAQLLLVAVGLAAAAPTVAFAWTAPEEEPDDLDAA